MNYQFSTLIVARKLCKYILFLHEDTENFTHVLGDAMQQLCVVIDLVLDFDSKSERMDTVKIL